MTLVDLSRTVDRAAKARAVRSANCKARREAQAPRQATIYTDRFAVARAVLKAQREASQGQSRDLTIVRRVGRGGR